MLPVPTAFHTVSFPPSRSPTVSVLMSPLFKSLRKCLGTAKCTTDLVFWFSLHRFLAVALRAALGVCTTDMLWKQTVFLPSSVRMYEQKSFCYRLHLYILQGLLWTPRTLSVPPCSSLSHYVIQAGLEFTIPLPQLPWDWDHRCTGTLISLLAPWFYDYAISFILFRVKVKIVACAFLWKTVSSNTKHTTFLCQAFVFRSTE